MNLQFIETSVFTREIGTCLSDDDYRLLQQAILFRPDAGRIIQGSGGLRKLRWKLPGMGKRGGIRVIYYFDMPDTIYLLFVFRKNVQENLTTDQLKYLKNLIKEWL